MRVLLFLLAALLPACATVVLRPAGILDVRRGELLENRVVVVEAGRIARVAASDRFSMPFGARVIELPGLTLMPGMIDAHVHLAWGAAEYGKPLPGTQEARATLAAGFTTVRNLGATHKADLALRDAIARGDLPGPRVIAAGIPLSRQGGICDAVFNGEGRVSGAGQAREKARAILDAGADVIKVCAGGGVIANAGNANDVELDEDEIRAIVDEAHGRGRKVSAHAQGPAAIGNAVRAGVDSIEHGGFIDEGNARLMEAKGTYLVPTMYRLDLQIERAQRGPTLPAQLQMLRAAREAMRSRVGAAIALGVPIALGTDATVIPHGTNARELGVLVGLGMTPAGAIRAATVDAANLLGVEGDRGAIETGRLADLIAVEGNPLADVTVLENVKWVMKGGQVAE